MVKREEAVKDKYMFATDDITLREEVAELRRENAALRKEVTKLSGLVASQGMGPNTAMIMGALHSGGDPIALAKDLVKRERTRAVKVGGLPPGWHALDVVTRPKQEGGTDHGAKATVLVDRPDVGRLLWVPGHSYWSSSLDPRAYAPASLQFEEASGPLDRAVSRAVHSGGKLPGAIKAMGRDGLGDLLCVPTTRRDALFAAVTGAAKDGWTLTIITDEEEDALAVPGRAGRLCSSSCIEGRHSGHPSDGCDDKFASTNPMEPCGCPCHGQYGTMCKACWRSRTEDGPRAKLPPRIRDHKGDCSFCHSRRAAVRRAEAAT